MMAGLGGDYRPMLQWVWDIDPTPQRVREQLQQVRDAAFAGVVIQPMPDDFRPHDFPQRMSIPYLSQTFFEAIRMAVDEASALGLVVWLYDEGGWPSGQACGQLLRGHEHMRGQMMVREAGRCFVVASDRADPLSLEATLRFINLTHDGYSRAVGSHFGGTIRAMFTDELTMPGCIGTDRITWTADLPQRFLERRGYDLMPHLPLLFEGAAADLTPRHRIEQVRHDYSSLCVDLFVERCLKPQREWCERHGLLWLGHFAGEHDLNRHPHNVVDYMASARVLHVPGVDTIWRQIWPDHRADFARFAGSVRAIRGGDAFSETGAVYGIDLSPAQWKWVCDQQILRGINRFSLMSLRLSGTINEGLSPLDVQDPTWSAMRQVNRHIAMLAELCSAGRPRIRHAVLYPSDDLHARGSDGHGMAAQGIMERLQAEGVEAIYVDEAAIREDALRELGVQHLFLAGGAVVSNALVEHLHHVEAHGVRLHVVGDGPLCILETGQDAPWQAQPLRVTPSPDLFVRAQTFGPLSMMVRSEKEWDAVVVFNESGEEQQVQLLDLAAAVYEVDEIPVRQGVENQAFRLAPGAVAIVQRGNGPIGRQSPPLKSPQGSVVLHLTDWRMQVEYHMEIGPENRQRRVPDEAEPIAAEPGPWGGILGEHFSGRVLYEATFRLEEAMEGLSLDLGQVEHVAEVFLDGQLLGHRAFAPYRVEWRGHLSAGAHHLRVAVSNTSAGAYWSDGRKALRRSNIYAQRISERCPVHMGRGLLGPVVLVGHKVA